MTVRGVETPELDRMLEVTETSQKIGVFVQWLRTEKHLVLAEWSSEGEYYYPASYSIIELLAEFFKIDLQKVEAERRAILATYQETDGS